MPGAISVSPGLSWSAVLSKRISRDEYDLVSPLHGHVAVEAQLGKLFDEFGEFSLLLDDGLAVFDAALESAAVKLPMKRACAPGWKRS
jgi:hypothetical protein